MNYLQTKVKVESFMYFMYLPYIGSDFAKVPHRLEYIRYGYLFILPLCYF